MGLIILREDCRGIIDPSRYIRNPGDSQKFYLQVFVKRKVAPALETPSYSLVQSSFEPIVCHSVPIIVLIWILDPAGEVFIVPTFRHLQIMINQIQLAEGLFRRQKKKREKTM